MLGRAILRGGLKKGSGTIFAETVLRDASTVNSATRDLYLLNTRASNSLVRVTSNL